MNLGRFNMLALIGLAVIALGWLFRRRGAIGLPHCQF
jgi:hypothetical protein